MSDKKHELLSQVEVDAIQARADAATGAPWSGGGPLDRMSLVKKVTGGKGPNGLSEEVYEIGGGTDSPIDRFPPGICIVNNRMENDGTRRGEANSDFITKAPEDIPRLVADWWWLWGEAQRQEGLVEARDISIQKLEVSVQELADALKYSRSVLESYRNYDPKQPGDHPSKAALEAIAGANVTLEKAGMAGEE